MSKKKSGTVKPLLSDTELELKATKEKLKQFEEALQFMCGFIEQGGLVALNTEWDIKGVARHGRAVLGNGVNDD